MAHTEAQTRHQLIDPQLTKAGWNLHDRTQVRFEIPASHGHDLTSFDRSGGLSHEDAPTFQIENNDVYNLVDFIRHVLQIKTIPTYDDIVRQAFDAFILSQPFSADQIRFLRAVQTYFVKEHRLDKADLYEPPFTMFGLDAVERLFAPGQLEAVFGLIEELEKN